MRLRKQTKKSKRQSKRNKKMRGGKLSQETKKDIEFLFYFTLSGLALGATAYVIPDSVAASKELIIEFAQLLGSIIGTAGTVLRETGGLTKSILASALKYILSAYSFCPVAFGAASGVAAAPIITEAGNNLTDLFQSVTEVKSEDMNIEELSKYIYSGGVNMCLNILFYMIETGLTLTSRARDLIPYVKSLIKSPFCRQQVPPPEAGAAPVVESEPAVVAAPDSVIGNIDALAPEGEQLDSQPAPDSPAAASAKDIDEKFNANLAKFDEYTSSPDFQTFKARVMAESVRGEGEANSQPQVSYEMYTPVLKQGRPRSDSVSSILGKSKRSKESGPYGGKKMTNKKRRRTNKK